MINKPIETFFSSEVGSFGYKQPPSRNDPRGSPEKAKDAGCRIQSGMTLKKF
jgi:hypothetical protein